MRQFGIFLTSAMTVLVIAVFAVNMLLARPVVEALLFSIALAVGLSPELLPAILNVVLARSAAALSKKGVLVKRLAAIENLGSMDVLCTDKTGTLTEGVVHVAGAYDCEGRAVRRRARARGAQRGPAERPGQSDRRGAVARRPRRSPIGKLAEIPYDFVRKRLSVVVRCDEGARLLTKGAVEPLLAACTRLPGGRSLDAAARVTIGERFRGWSEDGLRVAGGRDPHAAAAAALHARRRVRPDARGLRPVHRSAQGHRVRARWPTSPRWAWGSR